MNRKTIAVLAIVTAVLLFGQIVAYYANSPQFSISSSAEGGTVDYSVKIKPDAQYTELHLDNGFSAPSKFYVLRDDSYPMMADSASVAPTCYLLERAFARYASLSMEYKNADEILEMMDADISGGSFDTGIMILGGALPSPWYDGTPGSKIIQWMNMGGCVYWGGNQFGRYVSYTDGVGEVPDYDSVCTHLFGAAGIFNDNGSGTFGTERLNPELTELSGLYFANTGYGTDVSKLASPYMELGYTDGKYSSAVLMKYGAGMLCAFGDYVAYQDVEYMVHVLFLRMTYLTSIVDSDTGGMKNGKHSGSFDTDPSIMDFVFVHETRWYKGWAYDAVLCEFV